MEFRIRIIHAPGDRTATVVLTTVAVIFAGLPVAIVAVSLTDVLEAKETNVVMEINHVRTEERK